jgi:hypothetical protein
VQNGVFPCELWDEMKALLRTVGVAMK